MAAQDRRAGKRPEGREGALLVGRRQLGALPAAWATSPGPLRRAGVVSLLERRPVTVPSEGGEALVVGLRRPVPAIAVCRPDRDPDEVAARAAAELSRLIERDPLLALEASRPRLAETCALLARVAATPLSVLLTGETGVGKEIAARLLHVASGRRGPFVAENCAALPESLLEAELFGVRRGAFTGAVENRPGRIVAASGGTLFLDEIGDVPPAIQAKLLRVLQEREVRALGAGRARPVDVRIVSATHRNLAARARDGRFRADLYFRLAGVTVCLPPLRKTPEDLPYLLASLLARAEDDGIAPRAALRPAALTVLSVAQLSGNVRELDNIVRRALALTGGRPIDIGAIEAAMPDVASQPENLEAHAILEALE
ncbi:MAG: hypothetical protein D6738_00330, partial [Acidobacteria bacterium]